MFSPLEQYKILYFFSFFSNTSIFDFSITFFLILVSSIVFMFWISIENNTTLVPTSFFYTLENFVSFIYTLIKNILPKSGLRMFLPIFLCFFFIFFSNTLGLIPYGYCITSQLCITLVLALSIFFFLIFNGIRVHGFSLSSIFLPSNTSFLLSFLIIPIEIISFFFRPISLSVRLFSNMMAGHALLKVIVSFLWKLILVGSLFHFILIVLLVLLFFLEFCVACIQAYVFTMLFVLYTNDMMSSH